VIRSFFLKSPSFFVSQAFQHTFSSAQQRDPHFENNVYHTEFRKSRGKMKKKYFLPKTNFSREEREGPRRKKLGALVPWCAIFWWQSF